MEKDKVIGYDEPSTLKELSVVSPSDAEYWPVLGSTPVERYEPKLKAFEYNLLILINLKINSYYR
uniref:hypothetical protein n=1 Tax=Serratia proteamaculans TaxID=28151 RepID=UPI001F4BE062|nr:hypothetical protein [Serratia proteamaculans]